MEDPENMQHGVDEVHAANKRPVQGNDELPFCQKLRRAAWKAYCFFSFSQAGPLLQKGAQNSINETTAKDFHTKGCGPGNLIKKFDSIYTPMKKKQSGGSLDLGRALFRQQRFNMVLHFVWSAAECVVKFCMPFILRQFLIWLEDYRDNKAASSEGWLWSCLLATGSFLLLMTHHQPFWLGMMNGFRMRNTVIAAVHAKLLRLNTSCVGRISAGRIINLVSNDVQRFDVGVVFWPYLLLGPLEAILVTVFVSRVLGLLPALAGMSCTLLLIPIQALLSKYIGRYRRRSAKITDKRINLTSEIISGNLAVKMLGWEEPLLKDVRRIRQAEHELISAKNSIRAANMAAPPIIRGVMVCATFITYRFTEGEFNMPDVFFALSLMILPTLTLAGFFVFAVQFGSELVISIRRIDAFLKTPEPSSKKEHDSQNGTVGSVEMHDGRYGWYGVEEKKQTKPVSTPSWRILSRVRSSKGKKMGEPKLVQTLTGLDFNVHPGELVGIVGRVGSGKSSLLRSLLGDMENFSENKHSEMMGRVSFCSQIPWIVAGTVRENITFGQPFDEELYKQVILSCALDADLEQFPDGDETEIGERGINLSGGQKARLALARAAYFKGDIALLDDPLSAVDARVGRILFEECIGPNGLLKNSTRLLVTHQRQFLPKCDRIIVMNDGKIEAVGTWEELQNYKTVKDVEKDNEQDEAYLDAAALAPLTSQNSYPDSKLGSVQRSTVSLGQSSTAENSPSLDPTVHAPSYSVFGVFATGRTQLIRKEEKETGRISAKVYWEYVRHIGIASFTAALVLLMVGQILLFLVDWWVARWSSSDEEEQEEMQWVWALISFTAASTVISFFSIQALFALFVHGSTRLHNEMIHRVIRAPLKFFHTNPVGRILNRFAKDMGLQDEELPFIAVDVLINFMLISGTFCVVAIALPYMLVPFLGILWIFWRIRIHYVITSREVKRFDGITRSPVYAMISANLKGLPTIRAYKKEKEFQDRFLDALDLNSTWWNAFLLTSRWVGVRMDFISALIVSFSVLLALLLAKKVSPEVLGLALTYAIRLSGMMQWTMRQSAELENTMTAVERNMEYARLEQEPPTVIEGGAPKPEGWPSKGRIQYESLTASYRPGLNPVLKKLNFVIPGGSSVGIIGRTGSGKSSLLLTLFRLVDVHEGRITIDGLDIASIGVDALRKQLAVIPQDPVLFSGTLRFNLDPWNEQSDAKIWAVLSQVCLDAVANEAGGLGASIADCGSNLSVGQRQLLCLARALLSEAKILALDEATANVDGITDGLIQNSLHSLIHQDSKTLLIIAHRIDTVMGCDLILVLENGELAEFGSPAELLTRQAGTFSRMVSAAKLAQLSG